MKRTLLLDADIIAYKFAAATEKVFYFDGKAEEPAFVHDFDAAMQGAEQYIAELVDKLNAEEAIICLTDPDDNFRKHIWPEYKGNRKGVRKPTDLTRLKEWFTTRYQTYQRPGLEADDCMGILATHPTLIKGEKIIVSENKDMQSIPALLYNPAKDKKPRKIGALSAARFHLWQTIVGDTSDGYPGARGIGPKSAEAQAVLVSKSVEEAWGHVLAAFERAALKNREVSMIEGEPADEVTARFYQHVVGTATIMARLARILRASDWQFKERGPILWRPPITA